MTPTSFTLGISNELWHDLTTNVVAPLTNKVVSGQYAPGSTFKGMVALAALEAGAIAPNHTVFCGGSIELGDHTFHCWSRGGHGTVGLIDAVAESCDVFFYDVGHRVGIDKIAETARKFGLGAKLDIDLPSEKPGLMPDRDWKQRVMKTAWQQGETLVSSIGQGSVLATPLQLAVMMARMANGGHAVSPKLVMKIGEQVAVPESWPEIGVSRAPILPWCCRPSTR